MNKPVKNKRITISISVDGHPVKIWMNFDEWKVMNDFAKKREVEYLEWMMHGRKTN